MAEVGQRWMWDAVRLDYHDAVPRQPTFNLLSVKTIVGQVAAALPQN